MAEAIPAAHRSWVDIPAGSTFGLDNLPYGSFATPGGTAVGVAVGDSILNLSVVAKTGLLDGALPNASDVLAEGTLDALLAEDAATSSALRARVRELLDADNDEIRSHPRIAARAVVDRRSARMLLPFTVRDYVDFYASLEHATNAGRIFRPNGEPLMPNWRHMPVGYHGRSGTIVVSETPIVRPHGQWLARGASSPAFGPTQMLDFEIEVGFVMGRYDIFGAVLLNDWSARDIQAWETAPLGPFLGKSFATTISPWVVPLDALQHARVASPSQDPMPLPHLRVSGDWAFDIELTAEIETAAMRARGDAPVVLSRTNLKSMYWTIAQMIAHMTSNGAHVRAGDLYATGTVSGADPASYGSMLELSWRGERPLKIAGGETRSFLEDGDTLTLRGAARGPAGYEIGFGAASGTIVASLAP